MRGSSLRSARQTRLAASSSTPLEGMVGMARGGLAFHRARGEWKPARETGRERRTSSLPRWTVMEISRPYLLFLGDVPDQLAAKTAQGIVDWRPEWCLGQ